MADGTHYYRDAEGDVWRGCESGSLALFRYGGLGRDGSLRLSFGTASDRYGPLVPCDEFGNDLPGETMAITLDYRPEPLFSVGDPVTHGDASATITYGPLRGTSFVGGRVYVIRYGDEGDEATAWGSELAPRAEFDPGQTAVWEAADRVTILSGPHRDRRGTRMYAVQNEESGELNYAPAADLVAEP